MTPERARRAIELVDLTNLNDDCDAHDVEALCERAERFGTAAVCVWPDFVGIAGRELAGSRVEIATVVNFPSGDERPFSVAGQAERALADGATEIDVVLPYRAVIAGDDEHARRLLAAVRTATDGQARLKVILETGELPDLACVRHAAQLAIDGGAEFIKTSTGKSPVSATPDAVATMLDVIARSDRAVGIKPSGGISSAADAATYLDLADEAMGTGWVEPATFRFGASSLLASLITAAGIDAEAPSDPSGY